MANRLINWLTFNLAFASIPLVIALLFRALANRLTFKSVAESPEILFFAIMVGATSLRDLREVTEAVGGNLLSRVSESALFLGTILASILYGGLRYDTIIGPGSEAVRVRLLWWSIGIAIFLFICGTIVELFIGRLGGKRDDL